MKPAPRSSTTSVRLQRLLALAFAGVLLFDFPLLVLWSSNATMVFVLWALLIVLLAVVIERGGEAHGDDDDRRDVAPARVAHDDDGAARP
jgi:hypothetical protein